MTDKNFKIIGLTGQSGAGKSTVSKAFESFGVSVINADELAHKALKTDECKKSLAEAFGKGIFDEDGEVIRKALAKAAFSSKENTQKLNKATHPVIAKLAQEEFETLKKQGAEAVVFDAPTLIESGLDAMCSLIVSVIADKSVRVQRIMKRDGLNLEEAMLRLNAQQPDEFYTAKSDFIIENNETEATLRKTAEKLSKELFDE